MQTKRLKSHRRISILGTIILVLSAAIIIFPLAWVFLTSFKSNKDFYSNVWGLPKHWEFDNYVRAWTRGNISTTAINSVIVTLSSLVLCLVCSTTTAYALARYRFRLRGALRSVYLAAIMVPSIISLIPQYFLLINLRLLDSLIGLILVYALSSVPFAVLVLYSFFQTLPHEVEEAALIEGAGYSMIFRKIMLPLAQPGVITVSVIAFIDFWNEYFKAMTYISSPAKMTIPVGLVVFTQQSQYRIDWGALMASNVIIIIPAFVVYILFQNSIQTGLTTGAVKG